MPVEEIIHGKQGTDTVDISRWGMGVLHNIASVTKQSDSRHVSSRGVSPV
jgi:hypothetical protein